MLPSHRGVRRVVVLLLFLSGCTDPSLRPHRLSNTEVTPGVWGVLALPAAPGPHPAVILLPGSFGWRTDYARFARKFADSGYVALALDYYAETGRGSSPAAERANWPAWQASVHNAIAYLDTLPDVAHHPIALVGYSRGAFLAVSVAGSRPLVKAVVDYYGGGSDDDPPANRIASFPPLLILHGESDAEIPVALAHRLFDRLTAGGGTVEIHLYPEAQHVFNGPWASTYSRVDSDDAWRRTFDFLRRRVGG